MKTLTILLASIFILFSTNAHGQYLETFPIDTKGILMGPCPGGTSASCVVTDFTGVLWDINGNFTGFDAVSGAEDYILTIGGVLEIGGDIDEELCYEGPVLDISAVGGPVSLSVDLVWNSQDDADYVDVEYQIDGGAWIQIPNFVGGGTHTIDYLTSGNTGSGTITTGGLVGSTLSVRVCADTNTSGESTTIDNVSVPEVGAEVLPVKWADFKVRSLKRGNLLEWATFTEINNEKFEIEKSMNDMLHFNRIGIVDGVGNSSTTSNYEFLDQSIFGTISFYRVKQVDFDGRFEYSEVLVVKNDVKGKIGFSPNPFSSQLVITSDQPELIEGTTLRMFNGQGQLMLSKSITDLNIYDPIDTDHLNAGMYFIHYSNGEVLRVVKL